MSEPLSPERAIYGGYLRVRLPVRLTMMGILWTPVLAFGMGAFRSHIALSLAAVAAAVAAGALTRAVAVPLWRRWAYAGVADIAELKRQAIAGRLIFPDGHWITRLELAPPALSAELARLEAAQAGRMIGG
ncbi:hypothetical protein [Phenylobacterium aquaticum]|uniref:hypothetical protein n=1 Tax=Phenylobacterium aquaticum TaxID=1763816 RepID=UPI0026F1FC8D|nr:hypothetical protein [Phenylobacterium aquaticum]